jgi:hypothetical protein
MTFGQQAGPPASAKQVAELLALLHAAGHTDFRDARGPLGLTQRQAAGKFTRDEAAGFIEQLTEAQPEDGADASAGSSTRQHLSAAERAIRAMPSEQLAAELHRRGWIVIEP